MMRITKIMFSCCLITVLCGCTLKMKPAEISGTLGTINCDIVEDGSVAPTGTKDSYTVYEIDATDTIFNDAIANNEIDKAYKQEIQRVATTDEMAQVELKYITMWQEELEKSVSKFRSILSDVDADALNQAQADFDEFVKASFEFDADLILQKKYNVQIGTVSNWLLYCEKREAIRARTIHVKYLHYLAERSGSGEDHAYLSLLFECA